jgi:transposase
MSISELKHVSEPAQRIEVFTGHGRRRSWTNADKLAIVAESYDPGASVCNVARRHGLTPQQLFTWRREARKRLEAEALPVFVPAVITPEPMEPAPARPSRRRSKRTASHRRAAAIELEVSGVTVRISDGASPATIAAVIDALKGGS